MIALSKPFERRGRRDLSGPPRINLLPDAFQTQMAVRFLLRQWGAALGIGCVVIFLGVLTARSSDHGARQLRLLLAGEEDRIIQEERTAAKLNAQAEALRRRVAELVAVRAPNSWSQILRGLAASVPTGVVLKKVDLVRRTPAAEVKETGAQADQTKKPPRDPGLELRLEGLAERYEAIVELHDRLRSTGEFQSVALVRSGLETIGASQIFAFSLICRRAS